MQSCREREILQNIDELEREIAILRCELIAETESKLNGEKDMSRPMEPTPAPARSKRTALSKLASMREGPL
jgi:hypothetical protein